MTEDQLEGLNIEQPIFEDIENQKFTCYGLKLDNEQIIVTINNKNVCKFNKTDFHESIDFTSMDQIGNMIGLLRENGVPALVEAFDLPSPS